MTKTSPGTSSNQGEPHEPLETLEVFDAAIASLLQVERQAPLPGTAFSERVLGRVQATVAAPPAAPVAGAGVSGVAKLLVAVLVAGGGAGGWLLSRPTEAPGQPHADPAAAVAGPESEAPANAEAVFATVPERVEVPGQNTEVDLDTPGHPNEPEVQAAPPSKSRPAMRRVAPPEEYTLLTQVRTALGAGELKVARRLLQQYRRLHPRGLLGEEHDVLALRLAHVVGDAQVTQRLLARFRADYPNSLHTPALDAMVSSPRVAPTSP